MKAKLFALALCAASAFCAEAGAQIIRDDELAKYAVEKYGEDWEEAATKIAAEHPLDANNAFTFTEVLQAPGMDANKIYDELQMWFTSTFVDSKSVIQTSERERGLIIARGFISGTGSSVGAFTSVDISITPTIKVQIKDERIRVTYSVPFYIEVLGSYTEVLGTGILGDFGDVFYKTNVTLDKTFPFGEVSGFSKRARRRAYGRSLVMCNAYANVVLDKLDKVIKNGFDGSANEEW